MAHDCRVGSHTILANAAALSGHVEVQDFATLGGLSGVHQFCRVGTHAFVGGATVATKDVLPFSLTVGNRARFFGAERGRPAPARLLRRRRSPRSSRPAGCSQASGLPLAEALRRLEAEGPHDRRGARRSSSSCARSKRGVVLERRRGARGDDEARGARRAVAGEPLGLIAGNGRFPFLAAAGARRAGRRVVALALREETAPELEREVDELHWISLGQLGRGDRDPAARGRARGGDGGTGAAPADLLGHRAGPEAARRAGAPRVPEHRQPDRRPWPTRSRARASRSCPRSRSCEDQLALPGPMTRRRPDGEEQKDVAYGESGGARARGDGPRADGGREGPRGRGARGDGGHGRDDPPRGPHRRAGHDGGQGLEAEAGHALRRAGGGARARSTRCARPARACWRSTPGARC